MSVESASLKYRKDKEGKLILEMSGRLDSSSIGEVWRKAENLVLREKPVHLLVDASGVEYADGSGMALLVDLRCHQHERNASFELHGLSNKLQNVLDLYAPPEFEKPSLEKPRPLHVPEEVRRMSYAVWSDLKRTVTFLGELASALKVSVLHPGEIRWNEVMLVGEKAGAMPSR